MFCKPTTVCKITAVLISSFTLTSLLSTAHAAEDQTRAVLLNSVQGNHSQDTPIPVSLLITQGKAKGCIAKGKAYLNKQRLRYEYQLEPIHCIKDGQPVEVGQVVRGQHNIMGTMANSGMGRNYLISNKGVSVSLTHH